MGDMTDDPALAYAFKVVLDAGELALGVFQAVDGLGAEVEVESRPEGGNQAYVPVFTGRIKYSNVKLTRPVNGDTGKIGAWFATLATGVTPTTAHISALDSTGTEVARWNLHGVVPVRWTGPSLNADTNKAATETIEIAHQGFQ